MPVSPFRFIPAAALLLGVGHVPQPGPISAAQAQNGRQCFRAADVNSFRPRGQQTVDVRVGASRHYRLTLAGVCPDVDWTMRAALRTRGGGSWICEGGDAEIIVPSPMGRQRCLVGAVRRISRDEYLAARRR